MKIAVLSPTYRRPALTRIVYRYWSELVVPGHTLDHFATISPEDPSMEENERTCLDFGINVFRYANRPQTRKMNALLRHVRNSDSYGALLMIGSDDVLTPECIRLMADAAFDYGDFAGMDHVHFLHVPRNEVIRRYLPQTTIRMFMTDSVHRMNWHLWHESSSGGAGQDSRGLDCAMDRHIEGRMERVAVDHPDAIALDIKDGVEALVRFEQYEKMRNRDAPIDADAFMATHFPGLVGPLEDMRRGAHAVLSA